MRCFLKPLILAYYLPQFHEVKENNEWWGEGFTEWTNINSSKVFFKNHNIRKPIEPLGQYDLLKDRVIEKQFEIANKYGINGFLIWNYWFGNEEMLLEKPIEKILKDNLKVNYCLAWANHSWFNKSKGLLLKEQKYLGAEDYKKYFNYLLPHFKNMNYLKIDNKPIFAVFLPKDIPDLNLLIKTFNDLAIQHGFKGIYWLAENSYGSEKYIKHFDNFYNSNIFLSKRRFEGIDYVKEVLKNRTKGKINFGPFKYDYRKLSCKYDKIDLKPKELPVIFSGWDTTIRHSKNGIVLKNFNYESFTNHLLSVKGKVGNNNPPIIILKSWNEWAEGNTLEPDNLNAFSLLEALNNTFSSD